MKITTLLGNRILVKPVQHDPVSPIVLPEKSDRRSPYAEVLMLGTGPKMPEELKVGTTVRTDLNMGYLEIVHDGQPCRLHSILDVQLIL